MTIKKKRRTVIGFLFLLSVSISSVPALAGPPRGFGPGGPGFFFWPGALFELVVVGTHHLFWRDGAFYRKAPEGYVVVEAPQGAVISSLPLGAEIRIVDGVKYHYYNGIYYIRRSEGYMVVAPPVVTEVKDATPVETMHVQGEAFVTIDMLNVRSGPGKKFGVIALAYKGEVLKIYHESQDWIYVEIPSGRSGWVDKQFTSFLNPVPAG
ncbi:MAG: DUF6515 family protein [Desulfoplanes sp.]